MLLLLFSFYVFLFVVISSFEEPRRQQVLLLLSLLVVAVSFLNTGSSRRSNQYYYSNDCYYCYYLSRPRKKVPQLLSLSFSLRSSFLWNSIRSIEPMTTRKMMMISFVTATTTMSTTTATTFIRNGSLKRRCFHHRPNTTNNIQPNGKWMILQRRQRRLQNYLTTHSSSPCWLLPPCPTQQQRRMNYYNQHWWKTVPSSKNSIKRKLPSLSYSSSPLKTYNNNENNNRIDAVIETTNDCTIHSNNNNVKNVNNSNKLNQNRFNVGDTVLVPLSLVVPKRTTTTNDNDYEIGMIREKRGAGWYTVELLNSNANDSQPDTSTTPIQIKCRGTQLRSFQQPQAESVVVVSPATALNDSKTSDTNTTEIASTATALNKISAVSGIASATTPSSTHNNDAIQSSSSDENIHSYNGSDSNNNNEPMILPSPPTIHNLDELLFEFKQQQQNILQPSIKTNDVNDEYYRQIQFFSSNVREWVVFSDLHCSSTTVSTCIDVLKTVHAIALKRSIDCTRRQKEEQQQRQNSGNNSTTANSSSNKISDDKYYCGILFLGDFWHHRNTVRIDCLNRILQTLREFQVPMIMIPGNHDQLALYCTPSTIGDSSTAALTHALTPLQNSYRIVTQSITSNDDNNNVEVLLQPQQPRDLTVPGILIFTYPTVFQNAMFVPHIRDCAIMESIIATARHNGQFTSNNNNDTNSNTINALFMHADVTGASMNDLIVSHGGVPPSMFPPNIPIYSGHFHKPHILQTTKVTPFISPSSNGNSINSNDDHTVNTIKIEYVGSPYEVSLAEANQSKSLLVLDSNNGEWKCIERIPINIGRKHYKIQSIQELIDVCNVVKDGDRVVLYTKNNNDDDTSSFYSKKTDISSILLANDKINNRNNETTALSQFSVEDIDEHCTKLYNMGVTLEIKEATNDIIHDDTNKQEANSLYGNNELEDMSTSTLWKSYLDHEVGRGSMSIDTRTALEGTGLKFLSMLENNNDEDDKVFDWEVDDPTNTTSASGVDKSSSFADTENPVMMMGSTSAITTTPSTALDLTSVTITGFGPFRDQVTYPLDNRGLVLVRGANKDGGSDSNGAGKTALAMSILWALTGSLDPRPLQDSKVTDVVNDDSKLARVTLKGTLNGMQFSISRTKTSTKGGLVFLFNDEDITTQSVKETQELIYEKLGISSQILSRTMFHGQHALNELLDSTDTQLKEELSLIVPIDTWQDAMTYARKIAREASNEVTKLEGMASLRTEDLAMLQNQLKGIESEFDLKERKFLEATAIFENEVAACFSNGTADQHVDIEMLEQDRRKAAQDIEALESQRKSFIETRNSEIDAQKQGIGELSASMNTDHIRTLNTQRSDIIVQEALAKDRLLSLEQTWNLDLLSGLPEPFSLPADCPTCGQLMDTAGTDHSHVEMRDKVKLECEMSISNLKTLQEQMSTLYDVIHDAESTDSELKQRLVRAQDQLDNLTTTWDETISEIDKKLVSARSMYSVASERLSSAAQYLQRETKLQSLNATINAENETLKVAKEAVQRIQKAIQTCEERIRGIQDAKYKKNSKSNMMSDLSQAFGPRGIQTFMLQNTVASLESTAQSYLDELSDGAQRLQLSLDSGDRIIRRAFVRGVNGSYKERPLASLSGGQWKRCSLALNFAFADIVARRGRFRPSLCVMDEPLTHLDHSGRADVGKVLRRLLRRTSERSTLEDSFGLKVSTILIILQDLAAEELGESFDCIDEVVKENGTSNVRVDDIS